MYSVDYSDIFCDYQISFQNLSDKLVCRLDYGGKIWKSSITLGDLTSGMISLIKLQNILTLNNKKIQPNYTINLEKIKNERTNTTYLKLQVIYQNEIIEFEEILYFREENTIEEANIENNIKSNNQLMQKIKTLEDKIILLEDKIMENDEILFGTRIIFDETSQKFGETKIKFNKNATEIEFYFDNSSCNLNDNFIDSMNNLKKLKTNNVMPFLKNNNVYCCAISENNFSCRSKNIYVNNSLEELIIADDKEYFNFIKRERNDSSPIHCICKSVSISSNEYIILANLKYLRCESAWSQCCYSKIMQIIRYCKNLKKIELAKTLITVGYYTSSAYSFCNKLGYRYNGVIMKDGRVDYKNFQENVLNLDAQCKLSNIELVWI